MNKETELKTRAVLLGATTDVLEAMTEVISAPVLDTNGDALVLGRKYFLNKSLVRLEKIQFGMGNIMSVYYWVWFVDTSLDIKRVTIDGRHTRSGVIFQSDFTPKA